MENVTVKSVLECTKGTLLSGNADLVLKAVSTDSREVSDETLFVPIVGENKDAHAFVEKALLAGAPAALTARREIFEDFIKNNPGEEKTFILVEDTTKAIQEIGKMARLKLKLPAIGVTGSVGKTTTREMISAALSAGMKVYKTEKNYNNWLGVPLTLCDMSDDYDIGVLELGLNVRGELPLISSLTNIETAVITNIGVAHIEYYGTKDEICKEKFTITKGFSEDNPREKMLFLCGNDPYLMKYKDLTGYPYTIYGTEENAQYRAENVRVENGKYTFDFSRRGEFLFTVTLSVLGEHNVLNACAALAVADRYNVDLLKARDRLQEFTGFKNRLQQFEKNGVLIIDDTYNASPDSMKAGLKVLSDMQYKDGTGRRIAVLGDMFELGENAPVYHYEVGAAAKLFNVDEYLLVGENAKELGRGIQDVLPEKRITHFESKAALLDALKSMLRPGDIVYVKASNGMKLREITEGLLKDGE